MMSYNLKIASFVDAKVIRHYQDQVEKWRDILKRYIDTLLYLSTHNIGLRGSSAMLADADRNGNFLGLLQLLAKYDPLLKAHLSEVQDSQQKGKKMTTYLSGTVQNELLELCANKVRSEILKRIRDSKYFGMSCDATPDKSKTEQTTLIVRYVHFIDGELRIEESFIEWIDYNFKKGAQLAELYLSRLKNFELKKEDMRSQGYDNGSNMAGVHKGVQAEILRVNPFALFSSCGAHNINLCGVHAVRSTARSAKYFKNIQKLFVLFSGSPGRWEIVKLLLRITFKEQSETRWSERIEAVKPVATQQPSVIKCLQKLLIDFDSSLTSDAKNTANYLLQYFSSFESIIQGTVWIKALQMIQEVSILVQCRGLSLDHQVKLLEDLNSDLVYLRNSFPKLLEEAQHVAKAMSISPQFKVTAALLSSGRPRRKARPTVLPEELEERLHTETSMCSLFIIKTFRKSDF